MLRCCSIAALRRPPNRGVVQMRDFRNAALSECSVVVVLTLTLTLVLTLRIKPESWS